VEGGGGSILWARQLSGEGLHLKKWRVIVRNLPFLVTEEVVRREMGGVGFVWNVSLPTTPEGRSPSSCEILFLNAMQGFKL
jgi:nucleolar protein 4